MEKLFISQEKTKSLDNSSNFIYYGEDWNYEAALKQQLFTFDQVESKAVSHKILCGVHAPVYTLGNSLKTVPASNSRIPFVKTDRGGQLMYHGPGQLTIYPIFKLKYFFSGPREYSKWIFDSVIKHFKDTHGLTLNCRQNGLWLDDKKVGFLGLRIKNGIAYHGLSLNYNVNLSAFIEHSPCDIIGEQAGNIFGSKRLSVPALEVEAAMLSKALILKFHA
jgi:lipoyl(octanoyl) transferase